MDISPSQIHMKGFKVGISRQATPSSSEYMFAYLANEAVLLQMGMGWGGSEGGV